MNLKLAMRAAFVVITIAMTIAVPLFGISAYMLRDAPGAMLNPTAVEAYIKRDLLIAVVAAIILLLANFAYIRLFREYVLLVAQILVLVITALLTFLDWASAY